MGKGLGDTLIRPATIYLDTHIVSWIAQGLMARISDKTIALMEGADLRISPMVLIELEYLHEIGRVELSSREVQMKVEHEVGVRICNFPFASVARVAIDEKWTRDPFDRVIVAQAKLNGFSPLVSADEIIHQHYTMALS